MSHAGDKNNVYEVISQLALSISIRPSVSVISGGKLSSAMHF